MSGVFPPSYSTPHDSPGFLLWQVTNKWQRHVREALEEMDLTHTQFVVLAGVAWLSGGSEPLTQARLARHARTDVMMTSQILRTLTRKGYVERATHPSDKRAKNLSLTREGRKIAERSVQLVEAADKEFFGTLKEEQEQLNAHLRQLLKADDRRSRE